MSELPPLPLPPVVARPRRILPWVGLGCLGGLLGLLLIGGLLLALLPRLREELVLLVEQPAPLAPAPPDAPKAQGPGIGAAGEISADFGGPTDVWEQALTRVVDGGYELRVDNANFDSYGLFLAATGPIAELDVAVDVQQTAGPLDAEYGVRFRQPGPENYLMFAISSGGYYRLLRVQNNAYQSLVPWTFSPRIKSGLGATNRLRVVAQGTSLRASINDREVLAVDDQAPVGGQLALGVTTYDTAGAVVRFDRLAGQAEATDLGQEFEDPEQVPWSVGGSRVVDGQYELFAAAGIQLLQQPQPPGSSRAKQFSLEVDATLAEGSGDGVGYGVMFGYTENFSYYGLLLLPDGRMSLFRADPDGGGGMLVPPTEVPAIKQGTGATNRIGVELGASGLTITINGEAVIEDAPIEPIEGEVGLLLNSGADGRARALFDNFRLKPGGTRT